MSEGIKRQQGNDFASMLAQRQDRNAFLTDGGLWSWDAGAGQLSWNATALVRLGGLGNMTIAPTTLGGLTSSGIGAYLTLDRTATGPLTLSARALSHANNNSEDIFYIGVRGTDNNFYLIDGTVLADGETKYLGMTNVATDRYEGTGDGTAGPFALGFSYDAGSDQLAVFVGGVLQKLTTHYTETGGGTSITFVAGFEPGIGELITAINVAGGQGPPGAGVADLQDAYDGGREIETAGAGLGVRITNDDDLEDGDVILEMGQPSSPTLLEVLSNGDVRTGQEVRLRVPGGASDDWSMRIDSTNDSLVFWNRTTGNGIRFPKEGGIEHGTVSGVAFTGKRAMAWQEFSGTLDAGSPPDITTTINGDKIKGTILVVENTSDSTWQMLDLTCGTASSRAAYVHHDGGTPATIYISGSSAGTLPVGSKLQGLSYTLTVFYETN
jgi:hypothetical protein